MPAMIRPSLLDVSLHCPLAHKLSDEHGAGREALKGQVFHATCATKHGTKTEKKETEELFVRLTDEEAEEISQWHEPVDFEWHDTLLTYKEAEKELKIGLSKDGQYCRDTSSALTHGTLDMAWTLESNGRRIAIIGDIKKSRWTVSGPDTLQLWAYGLAYASKHKCSGLICGIWAAKEGEWIWGKQWDAWDFDDLFARVKAAATNTTGQACTGPHCKDLCYARFYCPEYCLPNSSQLAIPPKEEMDAVRVKNLLLAAQSVKDQADMAMKFCKEWARRNGGIKHEGKLYKPVMMKGKESVMSVKKTREALGKDAEKVIVRGEKYPQYRWVNDG